MKNEQAQTTEARWTAYALGELSAEEARQLEENMTAEMREHVEDVRAMASMLEDGFATEETVELKPLQRERIARAANGPAVATTAPVTSNRGRTIASVAAGALVALGLWGAAGMRATDSTVEMASVDPDEARREGAYVQQLEGDEPFSRKDWLLNFDELDTMEVPQAEEDLEAIFDATNGLEEMASRGIDNGGANKSGEGAAGPPSAGFFAYEPPYEEALKQWYSDGISGDISENLGAFDVNDPRYHTWRNEILKNDGAKVLPIWTEQPPVPELTELALHELQDLTEVQIRLGREATANAADTQPQVGYLITHAADSYGAEWSGQLLYDLEGKTITPPPVVKYHEELTRYELGEATTTIEVDPLYRHSMGLGGVEALGEDGLALDLHHGYESIAGLEVTVDEVPLILRHISHDDIPVPGTESYQDLIENTFQRTAATPLSTVSVDVDTASYTNVRRFLSDGQVPPTGAVRVEEMINYFSYGYAEPEGEHPFSVTTEVGACPWNPEHRLLRIGMQGKLPVETERKRHNLVFLLDVSGSMDEPNKLPLLKDSLRLLADDLTEDDTVAIVTYAGEANVHMARTHGANEEAILTAIDSLSAEGSTNGESGIDLAYKIATENFIEGGINRVMLGTDGDFNVGQSSDEAMVQLIEEKAKSGVQLSVLGYGTGNLKDSKLEGISGKGDGNYAYIDGLREAKRVLVDELDGTLETIAKDVKLQVDFNPGAVASYRLIGYENRMLAAADFTDDTKDAGEIGAGHRVTALYEIVPGVSAGKKTQGVEPSKYVAAEEEPTVIESDELCEVRVRYKAPGEEESTGFRVATMPADTSFDALSEDTRFAASVAAFGMALSGSPHRGSANLEDVSAWATRALGDDVDGRRAEFCDLVLKARELGVR